MKSINFLPVDYFVLAYNAILAVSVVLFRDNVSYWQVHLGFNLAVIVFVVYLTTRPLDPDSLLMKSIRRWYFLILLLNIYEQTGGLVFLYVPEWLDNNLAALEYKIFGIHPTIYLQKFNLPALNEYFMFGYFAYFFLILSYAISLIVRRMFYELDMFVTAVSLTFLTCFILFYFAPIAGPRFLFSEIYDEGLRGYFFVPLVDFVIRHGAAEGGSMPSSHTAAAIVILVHAWRYSRRIAVVFTPIIFGLVVGTFWGRFHFISDTIIGLFVAIICIIVADWIADRKLLGGDKLYQRTRILRPRRKVAKTHAS